ncbi:hypothetical protein BT67DRAFT_68802 [Trichocladium antarcticum]|uniref:Uncharacterized protein n=1 Tax=Trichocladium antarcticum TaxID=1450529 RepID=A0AAN6ZCQ9_9PEZI|nr:hypothetical protein BT67DRAFT_68802 [Trichocladium antarcticum]
MARRSCRGPSRNGRHTAPRICIAHENKQPHLHVQLQAQPHVLTTTPPGAGPRPSTKPSRNQHQNRKGQQEAPSMGSSAPGDIIEQTNKQRTQKAGKA